MSKPIYKLLVDGKEVESKDVEKLKTLVKRTRKPYEIFKCYLSKLEFDVDN